MPEPHWPLGEEPSSLVNAVTSSTKRTPWDSTRTTYFRVRSNERGTTWITWSHFALDVTCGRIGTPLTSTPGSENEWERNATTRSCSEQRG